MQRKILLENNDHNAFVEDVSVGVGGKRKISKPLAEAIAKFWTEEDLS